MEAEKAEKFPKNRELLNRSDEEIYITSELKQCHEKLEHYELALRDWQKGLGALKQRILILNKMLVMVKGVRHGNGQPKAGGSQTVPPAK